MIESPNYPNPYPHNRNCEWRITVESGRQVLLNVTAFDIEVHAGCSYDYLEIRYNTNNLCHNFKLSWDTVENFIGIEHHTVQLFMTKAQCKGFHFGSIVHNVSLP